MKPYKISVDAISQIAKGFGYKLLDYQENIGMISFANRTVRLNFYLTKLTIGVHEFEDNKNFYLKAYDNDDVRNIFAGYKNKMATEAGGILRNHLPADGDPAENYLHDAGFISKGSKKRMVKAFCEDFLLLDWALSGGYKNGLKEIEKCLPEFEDFIKDRVFETL